MLEGMRQELQMIELNFTSDDGPVTVQIHTPVPRPNDPRWSWQVDVYLNGRKTPLVVGDDPFEAIDMAVSLAAAYVRNRPGLKPPVYHWKHPAAPDAPSSASDVE